MRVAILILIFAYSLSSFAQVSFSIGNTTLEAKVIADNLFIPWDFDMDADGRLWFSERDGKISRLNIETGEIELIFQIPTVYQSTDNSGLHAMALHPQFPIVPYVFCHYTTDLYNARLTRFTYSTISKTFVDSLHLLPNIPGNESHVGSRIVFEDNKTFYLSTGDAYDSNLPQDQSSLAGKILRLTIDGEPAEGNPFGNYTYSFGHRNPQGLHLASNGWLYSAEHGTSQDDELNIIEAGRNYGWPEMEGFCDLPSEQNFCDQNNVREPLWVWTPTDAPCAIQYFNHSSIPEWQNSILIGFLKDKRLGVVHLNNDGTAATHEDEFLKLDFGRIREVFVSPNGKIYLSTSNNEPNGALVVQPDDDKIIEISNPSFSYVPNIKELDINVGIFPNPSFGDLRIKLENLTQDLNLTLSDLKGNIVASQSVKSTTAKSFFSIQRGFIPKGVYVLKLEPDSGKTVTRKVIFL